MTRRLPVSAARARTPEERADRARELRLLLTRGQRGLPVKVADWMPSWRALFEERAALMEFEGRLARGEAERAAEAEVRALHERGEEP